MSDCYAQLRRWRTDLQVVDAQTLLFPDASFDFATSALVINFIAFCFEFDRQTVHALAGSAR